MGKILITGISGFLGNHLLSYISQNCEEDKNHICLLTSKSVNGYSCILHNNYTYTTDSLPAIDTIIHLGAFCPKTRSDANNIHKNVDSIRTCSYLIEHLPNIPRKIVYVSTISVYGKKLINNPLCINEQTEVSPDLLYGHAKLISEKILEEYCKQKVIDLCILRLGVSYGVNDTLRSGLIPTVIKAIINGEELTLHNNGNNLKYFINVYDISRIIMEAAIKDMTGIVNVVDDKSISVLRIIKIAEKFCKKKAKLRFAEDRNVNDDTLFDNRVMVNHFGELQIDIQTGLKDVCEFYNGIMIDNEINNVR